MASSNSLHLKFRHSASDGFSALIKDRHPIVNTRGLTTYKSYRTWQHRWFGTSKVEVGSEDRFKEQIYYWLLLAQFFSFSSL